MEEFISMFVKNQIRAWAYTNDEPFKICIYNENICR